MKHQIAALAGCLLIVLTAACDSGTEGPPEALEPPTVSEGSGDEVAANTPPVVEPPPEPEPLPPVPDYQIVTRIRTRFLSDELVRPSATTIVVSSDGGNVSLSGQSETAAGRVRAEAIAAATYGVSEVSNTIEAPEGEAGDAASVPAEVAAVEPQFAEAIRNYETDEVVQNIAVISRANPRGESAAVPDIDAILDPVPDDGPLGQDTDTVPEPTPTPTPEPTIDDSGTTPVIAPGDSSPPPTGDSSPEPADTGSTAPTGSAYVVRDGDTLWSIAQDQMGAGSRWEELFQANSDLMGGDPDRLRAGMELVIPR